MRYSWLVLFIDALAVWRLGRLVTKDDFPPIKAARDFVLRRWPSNIAQFPDHEVLEDQAGEEPTTLATTGTLRGSSVRVEYRDGGWFAQDPHWFGQLIDCIWCSSVWLAGGVVALRALVPEPWSYLAVVLAFAALAGLINKLDS